jgi:hypothetical protein
MGDEGLRYDALVEDALRGVVRRSLTYVAERGLPGDHHFYITFRSDHPGVDMPEPLRARYPNEMTIVLQYQFWGLDVGEDAFGVTLSFADVPERLTIPYAAVTAFADPSVRFGLQFDSDDGSDEEAVITPMQSNEPQARRAAASQDQEPPAEPTPPTGSNDEDVAEPESESDEESAAPAESGKVITLDSFRKK